ncbi:hypothetical protein [Pseudomonas lurida]|uniref:hypothetical protein n=1 Tax=Pseudomonas lurida TaxID=244566 RepID=UPI00114610CC|nr:hypothetical protein [Pseudomonas lurida]
MSNGTPPCPQDSHVFFRQIDLSLSMHRRGGGESTRCIKVVPQPNAASLACMRYSHWKIVLLRNLFRFNLLICNENIVDCKSAYAGSIPTSASTLKSPAAIELAGLFLCLRILFGAGIGTILGQRHFLHVSGLIGMIRLRRFDSDLGLHS